MRTTSADRQDTPAWLLVTRREVLAKLTDRTFLIGTVVTVLLIAGFMGFQAWQSAKTSSFTVVATPDDVAMAHAVADGAPDVDEDVEVTVEEVADEDAARAAVRADADAWLHPGEDGWIVTSESSEDGDLTAVVEAVVRQQVLGAKAQEAGTSLEALQEGTSVTTAFLRGDAERAAVADAVGFAFVFLFYLAALLFGMQLASSVIEEKQSRIVEIIAAAIPLRHLLAGKVLGNTVLALLQVLVYVGVGLAGMAFTPYKEFVPAISGPVAWFVGFFVAGFVALSCLWAIAGALASRSEDLQATSTPLTMVIMVVFFAGIFLDGRAQVIGSFVPPLSAVVMPKRILAGGVEWWEPLLALALLAVFAAVTVAIGERLYRRALLQTGGRVSLRQAWTAPE
jgi:ABC-2 type transport system permease protein